MEDAGNSLALGNKGAAAESVAQAAGLLQQEKKEKTPDNLYGVRVAVKIAVYN